MKLFKTRLRSAIAVVQAAVLTAAAVLCTPVTALADKPVSKTDVYKRQDICFATYSIFVHYNLHCEICQCKTII